MESVPALQPRLRSWFEPGERTDAAPTIQVTIGRVEVRASQPSPAPKPRASPAPMSLDDYLRKRGNGGDR